MKQLLVYFEELIPYIAKVPFQKVSVKLGKL